MTQTQNPNIPIVPVGREVAAFDSYLEASKAVDALADADFPVEAVTIVGTDLKMVERVTGKLTWGKVLLSGAVSGALLGLMLSVFLLLLSPEVGWPIVLVWTLAGALSFAFAQGMLYAMSGGQRDFSSTGQGVVATRYGVQVAPEHAAKATALLREKGIIRGASRPQREVDLTVPPQFGERVSDGAVPQAQAQANTTIDGAGAELGAQVREDVAPQQPTDGQQPQQ